MAITQTGSIVTHVTTAGNGSTSITVPADAEAVEIHAYGYTGGSGFDIDFMTLGGNAVTLRLDVESNGSTYAMALGTQISPATGSQTFAWQWEGTPTLTGAGVFVFRFLKGIDTADPVRDVDHVYVGDGGPTTGSITLDSSSTDYVSGSVISYIDTANGAPSGSGQTEDLEDLAGEEDSKTTLFHEDAPGGTSTTLSASGSYAQIMGISWKAASGGGATIAQSGYRFYEDGTESGSAALAAANTPITRPASLATTVRMLLQASGDPAAIAPRLDYRLNGGSWTAVAAAWAAPSVSWDGVNTTVATGQNSCSPDYSGIGTIDAARDDIFLVVTGRSNTEGTLVTAPSGFTLVGTLVGGTGTYAADTGTRRVTVFRKDTVTGSESGTVSVAYASGTSTSSTISASLIRVRRPVGHTLDVAWASGADTSNDTSYSATASSNLTFLADDLLVTVTAQNIDTGTATSRAISATGVTFGTLSNRKDAATTQGNDHRHIINSVPVASVTGTPNVAPTYSYTISASGSGPTGFLRLRSIKSAQPARLALSADIAASAATSTTQRLSGTGTFTASRISDDTNPLPSVDIGEDGNTESAWSIEAFDVVDDDELEFRVTNNGAALSSYTQTPLWTVGTPTAPPPSITDVDTDDVITSTQTNVVITGTDFDTASVEIRQGSSAVVQSIDSQSSTSIQFDVVFDSGSPDMKYGSATLAVINDDDQEDTIAITIAVPSGRAFVDLGTPNATADNRITAVSDLASGDQLEISNVQGGSISDVTVYSDATFECDEAVTAFDVRAWDAGDSTWGSIGTQTLSAGGAQSGDYSAETSLAGEFSAVASAAGSLSGALSAGASQAGQADTAAAFLGAIEATSTYAASSAASAIVTAALNGGASFAGINATSVDVVAAVGLEESSTAVAGAVASIIAGVVAAETISAQAAAVAFLSAGVGATDTAIRDAGQNVEVAAGISAAAVTSALATAIAAVIDGMEAGEQWAAHMQSAAALSAGSELSAEFTSEVAGARTGLVSAHTVAAAQFLSASEALASVSQGAVIDDAIAAIAISMGQLSAGASMGAVFSYAAANAVLSSAGFSVGSVFAILATGLGSLAAGVGLTAMLSASAVTRASIEAGASFGAAFTGLGGAATILAPARATLDVDARTRSLRVTPRIRSTRLN